MTSDYRHQLEHVAKTDLPWQLLDGANILVTGATGLIGGCIVDVLMCRTTGDFHVYAAGRNEARAQKRFANYWHSPRFHFLAFDVTKELDTDIDFHFIIDAASGASPSAYASDPVGVMKANFYGVNNLLCYGSSHELRKFVFVSSGEIYGEGDGSPFTEDYSGYVNTATLRACYPSSKRAAETLCVCYAHQYGLDVSIARPSHVYGPYFTENDNRVYAQFIRNVLAGDDIVMKSKGEQFRSWCYVVDCASALLYLLLKGENMTPYNIADPHSNITIRELAETIASINGKKVVFDIPDKREKSGFSIIKKATFDTSRLQALGWTIEGSIKDKLRFTIEEQKHNGL